MNNSFFEIAQILKENKYFILFSHISADADSFGSCAALWHSLTLADKEAVILLEDNLAENLKFLGKGVKVFQYDSKEGEAFIKEAEKNGGYVSICVDCASVDRFPKREELFWNGKYTVCLDHHLTSKHICDYNYIEPSASATGEILYKLIKSTKMPLDKNVGEAIFAAITTDTGNFQYSNTNKESHLIAAELYDLGVDFNKVSIEIYERSSLAALKLQAMVLSALEIFNNGRCCISFVSQDMLKETGANMDDSEGLVSKLRSIDGIEVSILLREHENNKIKGSLRSKSDADVAKIAQSFGGGGHKKAAGFTLNTSIEEALKRVSEEVIKSI